MEKQARSRERELELQLMELRQRQLQQQQQQHNNDNNNDGSVKHINLSGKYRIQNSLQLIKEILTDPLRSEVGTSH